MIKLHRLGHLAEPFHLNPDLIVTIEAHHDTVLTLSTGSKVNVVETPDDVAKAVLTWRAAVITAATRLKPIAAQPTT
jgi:flagellar protein FlbD